MIVSNILQKEPKLLKTVTFEKKAELAATEFRNKGYIVTQICTQWRHIDEDEVVPDGYQIWGYK